MDSQPTTSAATPPDPPTNPTHSADGGSPSQTATGRRGGRGHDALVIVIVVVVIAGMLIAGKRLTNPRQQGAAISGSNTAIKGAQAPDFQLRDLNGNTVRLADLRGKAVLLNFWATWCPPCKIEIPWFVDLQQQYGPQGLQIIGVAMDEGNPRDAIAKFAKDMGVNYTMLLGNDQVADAYGGVEALPTTFYIGRDGKVVSRVFGLVSHREVEDGVRAALKQGSAVAQGSSQPAGAAR